jgi:putative ubiquitin-RnfH superfamily antitoxin RatB of RatAB toxin-antitoxin module
MSVRVSVAIALPGRQEVVELDLPEGSRVGDALEAPAVLACLGGIDPASLAVGVWSRRCERDRALREGDRVELYRPIVADAKAMRRERARLSPSRRSRSAR